MNLVWSLLCSICIWNHVNYKQVIHQTSGLLQIWYHFPATSISLCVGAYLILVAQSVSDKDSAQDVVHINDLVGQDAISPTGMHGVQFITKEDISEGFAVSLYFHW